ncbi:YciI family protein [Arhodomonas sp. SL1]|uniref:YciI family protein n=1 Tax=Arhodomonas sp. SL1 TaxID=3425691 RepID=UPI003F885D0A
MLMRKADTETEAGVLPTETVLQAMAGYNERMARAGVFVSGDGLRPSHEGCRITLGDGEPRLTPGPFPETGELLAGYTILEVGSLEEAIAWAKEWPREDGAVTLELRRYFTVEDFEPGAGLEQHRRTARLPVETNVHLAFPGNCREAMTFYAELTGGDLEGLVTYGETPVAAETPEHWHDRIIHASLNLRGRRLMGADMNGECYQPPRGVQVHLEYEDPDQAREIFQGLREGGTEIMPFGGTFFADAFGMVTDRFGIGWMIGCGTGRGGPQGEG